MVNNGGCVLQTRSRFSLRFPGTKKRASGYLALHIPTTLPPFFGPQKRKRAGATVALYRPSSGAARATKLAPFPGTFPWRNRNLPTWNHSYYIRKCVICQYPIFKVSGAHGIRTRKTTDSKSVVSANCTSTPLVLLYHISPCLAIPKNVTVSS